MEVLQLQQCCAERKVKEGNWQGWQQDYLKTKYCCHSRNESNFYIIGNPNVWDYHTRWLDDLFIEIRQTGFLHLSESLIKPSTYIYWLSRILKFNRKYYQSLTSLVSDIKRKLLKYASEAWGLDFFYHSETEPVFSCSSFNYCFTFFKR